MTPPTWTSPFERHVLRITQTSPSPDPATATQASMPQSALDAADLCLSPAAIGAMAGRARELAPTPSPGPAAKQHMPMVL